jgi:hypothetical protein
MDWGARVDASLGSVFTKMPIDPPPARSDWGTRVDASLKSVVTRSLIDQWGHRPESIAQGLQAMSSPFVGIRWATDDKIGSLLDIGSIKYWLLLLKRAVVDDSRGNQWRAVPVVS